MLNPYRTLYISLCVIVIYFTFFLCERVKLVRRGIGEGEGNIKQWNKSDGLMKSGSVFMHRKLFGCKSVTQLNDLSQSPKTQGAEGLRLKWHSV